MSTTRTRGLIFVHSAPRALAPHIEWAVGGILGVRVDMVWHAQPAAEGMMRGEYEWAGRPGMGSKLASILRTFQQARYEITEDASEVSDAGRWSHTPDLGIFYTATDQSGNALVSEDRIKAAMDLAGDDIRELRHQLNLAVGAQWDGELEVFRHAAEGAPVRWLHRVG